MAAPPHTTTQSLRTHYGSVFPVLTLQRSFLRNAWRVDVSGLSVARGAGKSTVFGAVADAHLRGPLCRPREEVVIAAPQFAQARINFRMALAFGGDGAGRGVGWAAASLAAPPEAADSAGRMSRHHGSLNRRRWGKVRRRAFDRDGWRWVDYGRAGRLEADHIVPLDRGGDPYQLSNIATRCRDCHIKRTTEQNQRPLSTAEQEWRQLAAELSAPWPSS